MTLATLLHVFPSFAVGGQQTRFATIANQLGGLVRHRIISLDGRTQAATLLDPDLDFTLLQAPPAAANSLLRLRRVAALSAAAGHDVLVTYNWGAIEFALANRLSLRRPHIHFEDGFGPDEVLRQKKRRVIARRVVLRQSALIVPSRNLQKIAQQSWGLSSEHVSYIPNGIDPKRFDDISRNGLPFFERRQSECVIGSFSPLRREKNISRLLRAFSQLLALPLAARLVLCGDGPDRTMLTELAARLGVSDRVTFTGHVPRPEAVMGAFDLFAITSDTEQMPYAVLEAMAARLPVLATAVGDIPTMVAEDNRPFVVPPADMDGLVAALARLCSDQRLRQRLGNANRAKVHEQFDIETMVKAFREVLVRSMATISRCQPHF